MVASESPVLLEVVIPVMDEREDRGHLAFTGVARLREGVGLPQVQAERDAFSFHMAEAYPENWTREGEVARGLYALTRQQAMVPDNSTFWLAAAGFLMVVGLILLITCSNVANLLLTRAHQRREELAVRAAVGARSRRILGQLLTENLVLFGLAGAASLLLIRVLASVIKGGWLFLPSAGVNFDVDARVAIFTFGLTLLAGLTFGLLPAKQASNTDLISAIKGEAVPLRFKRFGIRNLLVGVQVAGSTVFVMVTVFLLQSLSHVRDLDLGFDPEGVAVLSMNLDHRQYGEEDGRQFLASLKARLEGMPRVEDVEISTRVPLEGGSTYLGGLEPEGYPMDPGEPVLAGMTVVSPGYLDLLRVDLLRGRPLLPEDRGGGEAVALASQAFVDRYWPGEAGVGKIIRREGRDPIRVVGIVADLPMRSLAEEPGPHLWLPHNQWYEGDVVVNVRSAGDVRSLLPNLRGQVAELDPDLPVLRVDLMKNISANGSLPQRILSMIMGIAGALALALAMLGIYGVVAFSVSQRTREVGVRVALGAEPGQVRRMVVREGFGVALVGLVPGLLLSLAAAQVLRTFFLGADTLDPVAFGAGLMLLGTAVLAACLAPALRAARAHPMGSLRAD
jgi:putative ABC transport system permease protein